MIFKNHEYKFIIIHIKIKLLKEVVSQYLE